MPPEYAKRIEGFPVGVDSIACGLAVAKAQPVITPDVEAAPQWQPLLGLAREFGYRACWSLPLRTARGPILGSLALYFPEPRDASPRELEWLASLTNEAAIIVSRDIELRQREEAEGELREVNRRKDEFLAILAHELRNPLAPLRNGLDILRLAPPGTAERQGVYSMMERQLGHMMRLIDDLLDLNRVSHGKMDLRKTPTELEGVIQRAIEGGRPLIESRQHRLVLQLPPETICVEADIVRLTQVFGNLLNNAAKFTDPGGQITVSARRDGQSARVEVQDTGIGIPPHLLLEVFEMFRQVGSASGRSQGGMGLGLALARHLVELHGGEIKAYSMRAGQGSTFAGDPARLPRDERACGSASTRAADWRVARPGASSSSTKTVIPVRRRLWYSNFMGHQVHTAGNGPSALQQAAALRPDVVLLDIGMPGKNGCNVCRQLLKQPRAGRL
jgi:signal transduction histidine kinase